MGKPSRRQGDANVFAVITVKEIRQAAKQRGLTLNQQDIAELVGELIGIMKLELRRLLDKKALLRDIQEAESELEKWELILRFQDSQR